MQHAHAHRSTQNRLRSPSEDHFQTTSADRDLVRCLHKRFPVRPRSRDHFHQGQGTSHGLPRTKHP